MPEIIRRRHERPIVKFAIVDKNIKRRISKAQSALKYKVGLILTPSGKLQLSLAGERFSLWNYRSKKDNTFRSMRALYDAKDPLTRDKLNLKPKSITSLKEIVKNMRVTGILAELFIDYGYDQNKRQTVFMNHHAKADSEQYERLVDHVNTLTNKSR